LNSRGYVASVGRHADWIRKRVMADSSARDQAIAAQVLVADANNLARWAVSRALAEVGFAVTAAGSLEGAWSSLFSREFGTVIISLPLGSEDDVDFVGALARARSGTSVIVLCNEEDAEEILRRCAPATVMIKPCSLPDIISTAKLCVA
jgi:DNA-binding NtrC family response regulator